MKQSNGIVVRSKRGILKLGLGAALVAALSAGAYAQPGEGGGPGGPGGQGGPGMGMMEFNPHMLRELHLAPDQERKLKEDRLASQKKKIQLFAEKAGLELDLKSVLSTYPVKKADALKLADKIADVEKRMTVQKVENITQLLGSLTAEQHAKLMEIQDEWMEKRKAWREEMEKDHHQFKRGKEGKDGKGDDD